MFGNIPGNKSNIYERDWPKFDRENFILNYFSVVMIMRVMMRKYRSSRSQIFFKIGVLKNFSNFTRKHLCRSFFLIKLQTRWPAILLKADTNTGVFL